MLQTINKPKPDKINYMEDDLIVLREEHLNLDSGLDINLRHLLDVAIEKGEVEMKK